MGLNRKTGIRLIYAAAFLAAAFVLPLATGCSTLGIATTEELEAVDSRVQTQHRSNTSRLDTIEQQNAQMLQQLSQISSRLDTLETGFEQARVWLEALNLDEISDAAKTASDLTATMQAQSQAFLVNYLRWIKTQRDVLDEQLIELEKKLNTQSDDEKPVEPPPPSD